MSTWFLPLSCRRFAAPILAARTSGESSCPASAIVAQKVVIAIAATAFMPSYFLTTREFR
jgi:hypothetical protein